MGCQSRHVSTVLYGWFPAFYTPLPTMRLLRAWALWMNLGPRDNEIKIGRPTLGLGSIVMSSDGKYFSAIIIVT